MTKNYLVALLDFAVTRFLHRQEFFNPKNSFAVFYDQPYTFFRFPSFNYTLNGTGPRFSPGRPKITDRKIKRLKFICVT